jgi:hypothetical protein
LCCNGVLFGLIRVQPGEDERLESLGFALQQDAGEERLSLPCAMLGAAGCKVYSARPEKCRSYRCELLKKVEAGEWPLTRARAVVEQAKALFSEIERRAGGLSGSIAEQWTTLFRKWQGRQGEGPVDSALVLQLTLLNRLLDEHFRSHKQRRLIQE